MEALGPGSPRPFRAETHRHDRTQLLVITGGVGAHRLDGVPVPLRPPQLFLLGPGQAHGWSVAAPPTGHALLFSGRDLDRELRLPERVRTGIELGLPAHQPDPRHWQRLRSLLGLLGAGPPLGGAPQGGDAVGHPDEPPARAFALLLGALLVEAFEHGEPDAPGRAGGVSPSELAAVRSFQVAARRQPDARHGVAWHARRVGVSERRLAELLLRLTGARPAGILRDGLADEAGRLLRDTELPVARIASALGFADPAYFSRFVRRELGVPPLRYRAERVDWPSTEPGV